MDDEGICTRDLKHGVMDVSEHTATCNLHSGPPFGCHPRAGDL